MPRFEDGFFPVAYCHTDTTRMGAAWRYLTERGAAPAQSESAWAERGVDRLVFDGLRAPACACAPGDGER